VATYTWVQDRTNNQYSLGNAPLWWNTAGSPVLVATVPSPVGSGDTLVRTELYAAATGALEGNMPLHSVSSNLMQAQISLAGEVYVAGSGGFPNPDDLGTSEAVITAQLVPAYAVALEGAFEARVAAAWSTPGYVTSKGERGPAKYGSGHPELRVGLWADNVFDALLPGAMNSTWNIKVRCLWRTP